MAKCSHLINSPLRNIPSNYVGRSFSITRPPLSKFSEASVLPDMIYVGPSGKHSKLHKRALAPFPFSSQFWECVCVCVVGGAGSNTWIYNHPWEIQFFTTNITRCIHVVPLWAIVNSYSYTSKINLVSCFGNYYKYQC